MHGAKFIVTHFSAFASFVSFLFSPIPIFCCTKQGQEKGKAILVTGREDPYGCETSKLPHLLDNHLTDGGKIATFYPQEDSWYSFLLEAESTPGP
jgi:hypothetical protein